MYLLFKFDVCRPSITGDVDILKLVILLTLNRLKMMVSLLSLVRSRMMFILLTFELVEIIGLVAARGQLNQMTQLHLLLLMVGTI